MNHINESGSFAIFIYHLSRGIRTYYCLDVKGSCPGRHTLGDFLRRTFSSCDMPIFARKNVQQSVTRVEFSISITDSYGLTMTSRDINIYMTRVTQ